MSLFIGTTFSWWLQWGGDHVFEKIIPKDFFWLGFLLKICRRLIFSLHMLYEEEHRVESKQLLNALVIGTEATCPLPKLKQARMLILWGKHDAIFNTELFYVQTQEAIPTLNSSEKTQSFLVTIFESSNLTRSIGDYNYLVQTYKCGVLRMCHTSNPSSRYGLFVGVVARIGRQALQ